MSKQIKKYENYSREELIDELEAIKKKKYGLVWDRKNSQEILDAFVKWENVPENFVPRIFPVLKEVKNKEIITDEHRPLNLLIEGDNYHSLAVLNFTHKNAIDVIYIDPPYNTGNQDFTYNDKFVDKDDPWRHSKWLSFMEKRLLLAKKLLKDTGVIFISIDDNESAQLKLLCDEVFGEENLIEVFYIQVRYASKSLNEKDPFQKLVEQVLIYAKNKNKFIPNKPSEEYSLENFRFKIKEKAKGQEILLGNKRVIIFKPTEYEIVEEGKGEIGLLKATWASGSVLRGNTSGKFFHKYLENRKDIDGLGTLYKVYGIGDDGIGHRYFTGPKKATATKGLFYAGIPLYRKEEIQNGEGSFKEKPIINFYDYSGDFGNIRNEGGIGFRSGKKPIKLLKSLINLHKNKDALVLDFFAGSGSTGHAVLSLNVEDEGNRKFILCTNNENNIVDDVCLPRLKNVINGYSNVEGLGGNLKYFKNDFIASQPTDKNKRDLVNKSTEMICIKEDMFDLLTDKGSEFKIFQKDKKHLGIIFDEDAIEKFIAEANKTKGKFSIYCFSYGEFPPEKEFAESMDNQYTIKPIPEVILKIYREIFKK